MKRRADKTSDSTAIQQTRRPRRDDGASFIEMLVSIVLIGTVGIAVLAALAAATRGASIHRDLSEAQTWLANAGDAISDSDGFYRSCVDQPNPALIADEYESNIIAPITASASAPTIEVIDVEFWDSISSTYSATDACNFNTPLQEDRLQRVTIRTTVDGDERTLAVVKRPESPPTINTGVPPTTLGGGNVIPPTTPGL